MAVSRFVFEKQLLSAGVRRIAGVDEAGRGPLAGPVVAAAVILPEAWIISGVPFKLRGLNDSKQLLPEQRERFFEVLTRQPGVAFAYSIVSVEVIDAINILQASLQAMNEALAQLQPGPEHSLVDGLPAASLRFVHTALVEGDARSYSIAAASVIAKVARDRLMIEYDKVYPRYGFAEHKGYATPQHRAALNRFGPCPLHRRSFSPVCQPELNLFG